MIKRYTAVDGQVVNVVTQEIDSAHDRGCCVAEQPALPVVKLVYGDGRPHLFVFGTELGFLTEIEDMTVTL